jgi:hypothetical protein
MTFETNDFKIDFTGDLTVDATQLLGSEIEDSSF